MTEPPDDSGAERELHGTVTIRPEFRIPNQKVTLK
jgi:hypothetical protein